jgi:hypothetical protein
MKLGIDTGLLNDPGLLSIALAKDEPRITRLR